MIISKRLKKFYLHIDILNKININLLLKCLKYLNYVNLLDVSLRWLLVSVSGNSILLYSLGTPKAYNQNWELYDIKYNKKYQNMK